MIVSVRGLLEATGPDWVHIEVGGVTLQVSVPAASIGQLGSLGDTISLHTHLRFREEQPVLYGFTTRGYLNLFILLNGVSGVGPRISLALLSSLGETGVHRAISAEDVASLASAPGVGRRTAGRIILELKGALEAREDASIVVETDLDGEVMAALTALGYSPSEARQAVGNVEKDGQLTLEDRIRLALQQFGAGT